MKKKKIKNNGKTYILNRLWCYNNRAFCHKGGQRKNQVKYIVIHNTGNHGRDKASANANYFLTQDRVYAGAHFVIDQDGIIYQCGRLRDACYSVGGSKYSNCDKTGGGKYYGHCNNYNQVSIELCGIVDFAPTKKQIEATKAVVKYIQKHCKNAKKIIRHFDVNGKDCPSRFSGFKNSPKDKDWEKFKKEIM